MPEPCGSASWPSPAVLAGNKPSLAPLARVCSMKEPNVAIVGATGAVGEAMREILDERLLSLRCDPWRCWRASDPPASACRWAARAVAVQVLDDFDFADTHIALFSAGGSHLGRSTRRAPPRPARW